MLTVSTLLSQLTTMQQLEVEKSLQSKVAYNSSVLSIFNSMMMGESKKEIMISCYLNDSNYPRLERPILVAIQELYGLKAENARDRFLATVHYAIHLEQFENNAQKTKKLENLFHQMKRFNLEQESAPLLKELTKISKGSPLHAVYLHLYNKYTEMEENNNLVFETFEKLSKKLSYFLDNNSKGITIKDLIVVYKEIRTLHQINENRISETILNTSMLLLASHCKQTQLLKENKWSIKQLLEVCYGQISEMPFGVESLFMDTIFNQTLTHAISLSQIEINDNFFQRLRVIEGSGDYFNFGFNLTTKNTSQVHTNKELLIRDFVKKFTTFSPKQNSIMIRPNQI
ncbi:MAG: hypothetical protein JKY48_12510 [Flavobacteriales bacterium]|nr:hypothetical protein [Flavobacteriales bacterium]